MPGSTEGVRYYMETGKRDGSCHPKACTLSVEVLEDRLLLSLATPIDYALASLLTTARSSSQPLLAIENSSAGPNGILDASPGLVTKLVGDLRPTEPSGGDGEMSGSAYAGLALVTNQAAAAATGTAFSLLKAMISDLARGHGQDDGAPAERFEQAQREAQRLAVVYSSVIAGQTPNVEGERSGPVALPPAPQPSMPAVSPTPPVGVPPAGADADRAGRMVAAAPLAEPPSGSMPQYEAVGPVGPEDASVPEPSPLFSLADGRHLIELPVKLALPVQTVLPIDLRAVEQAADAFFAELDNLSAPRDDRRLPTHLAPLAFVATTVLFECLRRWEKKSTRRPGPCEGAALGLADVPREKDK
jgi:hypothetical protein